MNAKPATRPACALCLNVASMHFLAVLERTLVRNAPFNNHRNHVDLSVLMQVRLYE